jgi:PAS domain S-box-containing protein
MIESTVESSTEAHVKTTEKHIRILLVDDDSKFLRIAKELPEMQGGFQAETARCVEEAKDKLRREKYDAIVSGCHMPGKDGLEFLKELREENNDIPFIIFTGKGREKLAIKELLNLGADGYFEKHGEPAAVYGELAHGIREVVEKKRIKDALRSSQAEYKSLLQNIPGMVYRARPDWSTEIIANSKSVCGYTIQEFDSRRVNWLDMIHPADKARVVKEVGIILEGPASITQEYRIVDKEGGVRWVEDHKTSFFSKNGVFGGIDGVVFDVTSRKKMEQALHASLDRYRSFIEVTGQLGWTTNADGEVVEDIPSFRKFTGQTYEEVKGWGWSKALHPDDLERATQIWKEATRTKSKYEAEFRLRRHDGVYRYFIARSVPVPKEDGSIGEWVGTCIDITERKKAEDALRESEEKLRNIIESSPDAITITDLKGIIVDCNQAAVSLGGWSSKEELMGKSGFIWISEQDTQRSMENTKIIAEKGLLRNVPYTLVKKDGHEFPAELSAGALKDGSGNPVGIVAIIRDITERKKMQRELEKYSQQLEDMVQHRTKQLKDTQEQLIKSERLATIGQIAAMVGHDLRNPLTSINIAAYYLKTKLGAKAEKKMTEMLEVIEKDVQYSNKIITDLIDYSREIKLELTETTPKSIIAESVSLIQIPEKVQLEDSTLNEPRIRIDIDKMKRVFANFIKNAFDAMPQGGKLTISSRAAGGDVDFMLNDTGVGMAKEVSEKIWTPFFTTKAKGMGLGLAIRRRIIEAHQGKISVDSIVGEVTTFTVTIPLEPKPRAEGGEKAWVNVPESLLSTTTKA